MVQIKRKVIKQGNNTLTITLPRDWTEKYNVKAGDEIELNESEDGLLLNTEYHKTQKSISLNIDNLERLALAKLLIACFEQGYDSIILNFSKSKIKSWSHGEEEVTDLIKFFVARLIGFEVLSQTSKSITIGNLSEKLTKFENILSRIFFLIEEYLQHLVEAMKTKNYSDLKNSENRHDNITKLVALGLRMVSEDGSLTKTESLNYFTILNSLDKITDFVRYAYNNTLKSKDVSKDTIALSEKTYEYLKQYRHFFYKFDYNYINELDILRGEVKDSFVELSKKNKQPIINAQFDAFVETLHGIIKSRIALELSKKNLKQAAI